MAVDGVKGKSLSETISETIHSISKSNGVSKRKDRIATLEEIAEEGKKLLDDLSGMDKTVYDVADEMENMMDELEELEKQQAEAEAKICMNESKIDSANKRLEELDEKKKNGEKLTEAEENEYRDLKWQISQYQDSTKEQNTTLQDLGGKVETLSGNMGTTVKQMDEITEQMDEYKKAGDKIKASATKIGRNINCEKVMERNENSKLKNVLSGGILGLGGAAGGIAGTGAVLGLLDGSTAHMGVKALFKGLGNVVCEKGAIGFLDSTIATTGLFAGPTGWIILGAGTAIGIAANLIIKSNTKSQLDKYLDKMDMEEVADQTFQDTIDHSFMPECEAIENKGGNQVSGKLRKATVKVFSYGKSIASASDVVKKDATGLKDKYSNVIKEDEPETEE